MRRIMDEKKILIVNLSKGQIGESNANLLGSMLVTKIYLAALSRADVNAATLAKLPSFNLFVDEFQSFANKSFADILSEARKYKLNLHIAHQYVEQMPEEVAAAVFGNVGTMISFRIGGSDAEVFEKEFAPQFTAEDMVNLGKFQMYLKLMVDGVSSAPFSARTFPHTQRPELSYRDVVIARSREKYARPREEVEKNIKEWHEPSVANGQPQQQRTAPREQREGGGRKQTPDREAELRKAMSLDHLKVKRPDKKQKSKGPSQQNMSELRNALSAVLKEAQQGNAKQEQEAPQQKEQPKQQSVQEPPKQEAPQEKKEVPEHVLKKLLEMGDK
jgi:hypothetical protein